MPERRTVVPGRLGSIREEIRYYLDEDGGEESQDICGFGGTVAKQGAGTLGELAKDY